MKNFGESKRQITRRYVLGTTGAFLTGLLTPTLVDARTKRPGETDDSFSREDTDAAGYRQFGHNFISASGAVIFKPNNERVVTGLIDSNTWYYWSYLHPFKDWELYLGGMRDPFDRYRYRISVQSDQVSFIKDTHGLSLPQFIGIAEIRSVWSNGSHLSTEAYDQEKKKLPVFPTLLNPPIVIEMGI